MKIFRFFGDLFYYLMGHICILINFHKKRKYIGGRWFAHMNSEGWRWLCKDTKECFKHNINRAVPWPMTPNTKIAFPQNISFDLDDLNIFQATGCYFQAFGKISIGRGTYIANNVGLITANHDFYDLDNHYEPKPITIGEKCWIGMNSIVLPGVILGDRTIVGAGSVVTKSFPEGNCVIAGNPAKKIRDL